MDITFLQFMSKLLNFLSKKAHFKRKKLHGSFKWTPCGSGKKYKQRCGKQLANPDSIRENASFSFSQKNI